VTTAHDRLTAIGTTAPNGETRVSSEELEQLWADLMPDDYAARQGLTAFLEGVQAAAGRSSAELQFRPVDGRSTCTEG
jgi:hypothetical protein